MTRTLMLVLVLWTSGGTAVAQYRGPRSADYLFGTSARGSRASWVNPAALGTTAEASIMIEGFVQRDAAGDYPLAQYTIGFSSRGFAFGYRRDRFRGVDGGNTWRVRVDVTNERLIPTITERARRNNVVRPDLLTVDGNVEIIAAGWVADKFRPGPTEMIEQHDLKRILVRSGQPGRTTKTIEYLVRGTGPMTIQYAALKGGTARGTAQLR